MGGRGQKQNHKTSLMQQEELSESNLDAAESDLSAARQRILLLEKERTRLLSEDDSESPY